MGTSKKSLFVTSFNLSCNVLVVVALWQLWAGGLHLGWIGVLMTSLPFTAMFVVWATAKRTSRTSPRMPLLTATAIMGVVMAALPVAGLGGAPSFLPLLLAMAAASGVVLYVDWYSVFGRTPSAALRVGQPLPHFVLEDMHGQPVESEAFRGQPVVLLFYRGSWCPLCIAQIKEIAALYRQLAERGVSVKLVSPQPHAQTQTLAARFDVPFDFLVDPQCRTATQLGILSPDGIPAGVGMMGYDPQTVMPTVVITDAEGVILFTDETDNYRVRPEPETFFAVLDAHAD